MTAAEYSGVIDDLWQKRQEVAVAGHRGDIDVIISALDHHDPAIRRLAVGAAHRAGSLDTDRLTTALSDPSAHVVLRAIDLAARSEVDSAVSRRLVELLADERYCESAAFALGELPLDGDELDCAATALSSQATGHDDPLARESAVAALGALGVGLDAVLAGMDDVAAVRRRAVLALVAFDDERADEALRVAVQDRDWQVRQAAEDLVEPDTQHDR